MGTFGRALLFVFLLLGTCFAFGEDAQPPAPQTDSATDNAENKVDPKVGTSICLLIESAAKSYDLPVDFFTRLIWQESRFQTDAVGPTTHQRDRAEGIAQFMPGTAAERGLSDPFNPVQALPKSAEFLSELRSRFGNLGLAAAAYNSGPHRVDEWLAGSASLPSQTQNYVLAITGLSASEWQKSQGDPKHDDIGCEETIAALGGKPSALFTKLEQSVATAVTQPWGIQLSAGFSRENALQNYARAIKDLESIIGQQDPIILQSLLRSRGTRPFFQVRIGAATRPEANKLCAQIQASRHACIVLRNKPT